MMRNEIGFDRASTPDFLAAAAGFHHPSEVLGDPGLAAWERRTILADWASDAHASRNAPRLRQVDNGARIPVSEILAALRRLDERPRAAALRRHHGFATIP